MSGLRADVRGVGLVGPGLASFASESGNLRQSIHLLAPTLDNADKALTSLNASFPNTRALLECS